MYKYLGNRFLLSLLCGLLLWISWPVSGFAGIIFFAWIPLYKILKISLHKKQAGRFFLYVYLSMFVWNFCCTWWVAYSTLGGAALAILANSLLMSMVWQLSFSVGLRCGVRQAWITGCLLWLGFEWLHLNWELTWPWLTLGNVFSEHIAWIQWYEFTGVPGGSLWVLAVNTLFILWIEKGFLYRNLLYACTSILLPILIGILQFITHTEKGTSAQVMVLQPNIDPYGEKFGGLKVEAQMQKLLNLAEKKWTPDVQLMIGPETSIPFDVWEHELAVSPQVMTVKSFIARKNFTPFLLGASTAQYYATKEPPTFSARKMYHDEGYYDSYNSAILVSKNDSVPVYHKSRLVPGVERIPFPVLTKPLNSLAIDLGGTIGSLGIQEEREVFTVPGSSIIAAPVICYESVYGAFVGDYVKNGANLLCIITNDGWWDDSPGYRQHLSYAKLRAIEHRRSIARSANTGISGFINQRGELMQTSSWWREDALKQELKLNENKTLYTLLGDYIYAIAAFVSVLLLIAGLSGKILLNTFEKKSA
jgi:apolipoprotein N-acyltransferase